MRAAARTQPINYEDYLYFTFLQHYSFAASFYNYIQILQSGSIVRTFSTASLPGGWILLIQDTYLKGWAKQFYLKAPVNPSLQRNRSQLFQMPMKGSPSGVYKQIKILFSQCSYRVSGNFRESFLFKLQALHRTKLKTGTGCP